MLKNKKIFSSAIISLLVSSMLFTSCTGAKEKPTTEPANTKTTEAEPSKEPKVEQKKIVILSVNQTEDPEGPKEKAIADAFMKANPDILIEFQGIPMNELFKRITTLAASDSLPDMYTMTTEYLVNLNSMGVTADLNEVLSPDYLKEFYPNMITDATIDNKLMFLPWYATPPALIYRSDWFLEEGLKVPETWDEFIVAAQKLTKDTDGDGKVDRYGVALLGTRNQSGEGRYAYIMRTFGVEELRKEADGTWVTDIGSDKFKQSLQMFTDFDLKYKVVAPGIIETGYAEASQLLVANKAAMMITGPNALGTIYNQNPELQGKLASAPIPKDVKHISTAGLLGYAVSEKSKVKPEVARYLEFLTNNENSLAWNEMSGRLPTRISLGDSEQLKTPAMKGFVDALQYSYSLPASAAYTEVLDALGEAYQSVFTGEATVEQASEKAKTKAEEAIKNNK